MKDSSGDQAYLEALLHGRDCGGLRSLSILSGSEVEADRAMLAGADGLVPGLGNVDPHGYVQLVDHLARGQVDDARAVQERLRNLFGIVSIETVEQMGGSSRALGAFKAAMRMLGAIDHDPCASPSVPLDDEDRDRVKEILVQFGPGVAA